MQESPLPLQNRYQILQSLVLSEPQHLSEQHGTHLDTFSQASTNKIGKKMKKNPCDGYIPDVTHFIDSTNGNNKIGNNLGRITQEAPNLYLTHQSMHHITDSLGNGNGNRAKLGQVLYHSDNFHQSCTENHEPKTLVYELVQSQHITDNSTSHDLACMEEKHNDNYVYLYDVCNSPVKRKQRNIPEHIYHSKFLSHDYVNCIQQNGKDFGFLPLNNLMVYTGDEVTWSTIPSIAAAHNIVRTSAKPNFMGARIPVASQVNIEAWKFHLS